MGRRVMCCSIYYSIFLLFFAIAYAHDYHTYANRHPQEHNTGYYTQHTVFTNPLLYPNQSSGPRLFPTAFGQNVGPEFHHQHQQQQQQQQQDFFAGFIGDGDFGRIPFDGPLFSPAYELETAESSGQLASYNKALQDVLKEQFGSDGVGNNSNNGYNNGDGGDQSNFNSDILRGTSYVRVRQTFGDRKSNYDYQYAA